MNGFVDSFDNMGGHRRKRPSKKTIQIAKAAVTPGLPVSLTEQLVDHAVKGEVTKPINEPFSNIDGFDNASGKKLTPGQKGLALTGIILAVSGLFMIGMKIFSKSPAKK